MLKGGWAECDDALDDIVAIDFHTHAERSRRTATTACRRTCARRPPKHFRGELPTPDAPRRWPTTTASGG